MSLSRNVWMKSWRHWKLASPSVAVGPDLPHPSEVDGPAAVDLEEAERLEHLEQLGELADVGQRLGVARADEGVAALRVEQVDLGRVDRQPPAVGQVEQHPVVDDVHRPSVRPPVGSAFERSIQRSSGRSTVGAVPASAGIDISCSSQHCCSE